MTQAGYGFVNLAGTDEVAAKYRVTGIPHIFVIDTDGVIRYSGVFVHNEENIEDALAMAQ